MLLGSEYLRRRSTRRTIVALSWQLPMILAMAAIAHTTARTPNWPAPLADSPPIKGSKRPFSTRNRVIGSIVLGIAILLIALFEAGSRASNFDRRNAATLTRIEQHIEERQPTKAPQQNPERALPYNRTYSAAIVGDWFWGRHPWAIGLVQCPSGCKIDFHHDGDLAPADALLFHGHPADINKNENFLRQAAKFTKRQLVLLYTAERFPIMGSEGSLKKFNGEMSFRTRSVAREVQYPLEAISRFQDVSTSALGNVTENANYMSKTWRHVMPIARLPRDKLLTAEQGTVCWASNHCNSVSGREDYVRELLQHIKVEVYTAPCLKNAPPEHQELDRNAQSELWRQYKFYLAFENTRCNDYVTEKFYLALIRGQVPIVIGAANTAEHAPSRDSYIDTRDFATPKALAEYLLYLDKNETAYDEYFAWHDRPFSSYGAAFRRVLEDALPVAQVYYEDRQVSNSARMFACSVCHDLAIWQAGGRRLDGSVPPFVCDPPIKAQAGGKWA